MKYINPFTKSEAVLDIDSLSDSAGNLFPKVKGVYRVVQGQKNYTENFGFQWNKFRETQIDMANRNFSFSKERFFVETGWKPEEMDKQLVLEVGSGAGRFSHVVLENTNAQLYSIDFSDAVEANWANNGRYGDTRFKLFQASIYEMPFDDNQFDKVFCLGVLQHTPNFELSIKALIDKCKPGGEVVVDFYEVRGWWTKVHAKYLLRPLAKKLSHEKLLWLIDKNARWLIAVASCMIKIGLGVFTRFLPIVDLRTMPHDLTAQQLREWVVLDTFDMYSPEFDDPQTIDTVKSWFIKYGMSVTFAGIVRYEKGSIVSAVVRGVKS